jgi:SAM-dependent methyltransferase
MTWLAVAFVLGAALGAERPRLDVQYVPTPPEVVREMLAAADVTANDVVYDLGCGDGRIVIAAAKEHGARGVGVDIDPRRVAESSENARRADVDGRVKFVEQDLFETDLRPATVVMLYLLGSLNERLRPKLLAEARPGTRVVSHAFGMGEWEPDRTRDLPATTVRAWVVPGNLSGEWTLREQREPGRDGRLVLEQRFQQVAGSLQLGDETAIVRAGRVRGDTFALTAGPAVGAGPEMRLLGRVRNDRVEGTIEGGGRWTGERRRGTATAIDGVGAYGAGPAS